MPDENKKTEADCNFITVNGEKYFDNSSGTYDEPVKNPESFLERMDRLQREFEEIERKTDEAIKGLREDILTIGETLQNLTEVLLVHSVIEPEDIPATSTEDKE